MKTGAGKVLDEVNFDKYHKLWIGFRVCVYALVFVSKGSYDLLNGNAAMVKKLCTNENSLVHNNKEFSSIDIRMWWDRLEMRLHLFLRHLIQNLAWVEHFNNTEQTYFYA